MFRHGRPTLSIPSLPGSSVSTHRRSVFVAIVPALCQATVALTDCRSVPMLRRSTRYRVICTDAAPDTGSSVQTQHQIQSHLYRRSTRYRVICTDAAPDTGSSVQTQHQIQGHLYRRSTRYRVICTDAAPDTGSSVQTQHQTQGHLYRRSTRYRVICTYAAPNIQPFALPSLFPQTIHFSGKLRNGFLSCFRE